MRFQGVELDHVQDNFTIIFTTGKTAFFEPQPSLEVLPDLSIKSYIRPSAFHFFGFRNSNFFTEQGRQPCVQSPTWRAMSVCMSSSESVAQL
jgi:hypothetical protein